MLKFLRKYQLILLAVGGSLLMVAFLLQPVLGQLQPDPKKQPVAKIGDLTVTMGEQIRANQELEVLGAFLPELPFLLGLEGTEDDTAHWMLLKHEAERLGVMGVQQDGADWIDELAFMLTQRDLQRLREFGQQITPEYAQQYAEQALQALRVRQASLQQSNRGLNAAAFNNILSKARGVMRMRRLYDGAPQMSRQRAVDAFVVGGTDVLTDQLVLGPELLESEVAEPTDAEILAHYEQYNGTPAGNTDEAEGGNPFGFGYLLPARVKLEWLTLDRQRIADVVTADPVAVRRRWQRENPDGGDFAADRAAIQAVLRDETVKQIMADADEVIRGEILGETRSLEKEGIYRLVTEDWEGVDLEAIAADVVAAIQERHGVRIPLPTVIRRSDGWQTGSDLSTLPGLGQSAFRVGNQVVRPFELPAMVRGIGGDPRLAVQVGLPIIDPPAEDAGGSRYYITLLDARGESAPDSVDEIRARVASDLKSLRAFRKHESQIDAYREAATGGGFDAVTTLFARDDGSSPVTVRENIFVTRDRLAQAEFRSTPDGRADVPGFREAVLEAAAGVDPLAAPDSFDGDSLVVVVPLPASRGVALARVRAKRPPTAEDFQRFQSGVVVGEVRRMIGEAESGESPLAFAPLSARLAYEAVGGGADDDADG